MIFILRHNLKHLNRNISLFSSQMLHSPCRSIFPQLRMKSWQIRDGGTSNISFVVLFDNVKFSWHPHFLPVTRPPPRQRQFYKANSSLAFFILWRGKCTEVELSSDISCTRLQEAQSWSLPNLLSSNTITKTILFWCFDVIDLTFGGNSHNSHHFQNIELTQLKYFSNKVMRPE